MLHKMSRLKGAHIEAVDGGIGHIDDFLVDEKKLTVQYLVVDTSNWIGGKWVVISTDRISGINWDDLKVQVDVTREAVQSSSSLDSIELPVNEEGPPFTFI